MSVLSAEEWNRFIKSYSLPTKAETILLNFIHEYLRSANIPHEKATKLLREFIDKVFEQLHNPYQFQLFHKSIRQPFDYYQFGLEFVRPLVNFEKSYIKDLKVIDCIQDQCRQNENVILLSNHQIEPDPQVIGLLLEKTHSSLAEQMIFVAGHRVTTDPMAVPLSLGCNLLCIFSKKYMNTPPEEKAHKIQHNQKTLQEMGNLLKEGGKCIYVAPSGGRDRVNGQGVIEVAKFDAANIELFRLIAEQSGVPTHFYPMAIDSYSLLPPPKQVEKEIGEQRQVCYAPIRLAIGPEVNMNDYSDIGLNKKEIRTKRAETIWNWVEETFHQLHIS